VKAKIFAFQPPPPLLYSFFCLLRGSPSEIQEFSLSLSIFSPCWWLSWNQLFYLSQVRLLPWWGEMVEVGQHLGTASHEPHASHAVVLLLQKPDVLSCVLRFLLRLAPRHATAGQVSVSTLYASRSIRAGLLRWDSFSQMCSGLLRLRRPFCARSRCWRRTIMSFRHHMMMLIITKWNMRVR